MTGYKQLASSPWHISPPELKRLAFFIAGFLHSISQKHPPSFCLLFPLSLLHTNYSFLLPLPEPPSPHSAPSLPEITLLGPHPSVILIFFSARYRRASRIQAIPTNDNNNSLKCRRQSGPPLLLPCVSLSDFLLSPSCSLIRLPR